MHSPADEGVPDFWLTAMTNNSILSAEITDRDAEVLGYLEDLRYDVAVDSGNDWSGFRLEFHFRENPYFKNKVCLSAGHLYAAA